MQNFFLNYGTFLAEVTTVVLAIIVCVSALIAIANKGKNKSKEKISITKINDKYDELKQILQQETLTKDELKTIEKQEKAKAKQAKKKAKQAKQNLKKKPSNKENSIDEVLEERRNRIFVLDFYGDMQASAVENLRQEITAILTIATPKDEVVVKINSAGGLVHSYGLASSQLKRIKDRCIPLTVIVDEVSASGGYMMACVADRILSAPFAIIGSIGVLMQLPNFHKFLRKHNIDFEQITAGEYKRTLTMFGENTNKGRNKMQEEVEETHELFKAFVSTHRPMVNINAIATGEHWFGIQAKELGLVDDITTSDDYLMLASEKADLYSIQFTIRKPLIEKISSSIYKALAKFTLK